MKQEPKLVIDSLVDIESLDQSTATSILFIPSHAEHKRVMDSGIYKDYDFLMFAAKLEKRLFFNDMKNG